ncbi:hypothetical protein Moror_12811 [Moniliophthora roreri MCA 2997]|uniref:Thioesterase domain-containing protein n=1 Tax=Moniliophthora roreri (strain MCA 2997) TaxID=1381753 RepID=V2XMH6_MONRO|nr:hypothetical protein Moror_12811 [Moniliophthora roreri MCA 2997]
MSKLTIDDVPGNAPAMVKQLILDVLVNPKLLQRTFSASVIPKLVLSEVSINKMAEEPMREEGRVVFHLTVDEEMLNFAGGIHGGCLSFLTDFVSSLALIALRTKMTGSTNLISLSQALSLVFHSPAPLGDRLRVVSTTITAGARASSAKTEIWSDTKHRLVASGVHIKMDPSPPKAKM